MTHDLDDISVYACWTRLNETPEDIARMSMRFMQEFSTRIKTGPWEPLKGEWDGTEAGLVEVIKRNPITDDDGEPIPGDGYDIFLTNHSPWTPASACEPVRTDSLNESRHLASCRSIITRSMRQRANCGTHRFTPPSPPSTPHSSPARSEPFFA